MNPNKQNVNMSLKRNTGTPRDRNPVCCVKVLTNLSEHLTHAGQ